MDTLSEIAENGKREAYERSRPSYADCGHETREDIPTHACNCGFVFCSIECATKCSDCGAVTCGACYCQCAEAL